jgi:sugar/nucleoside kinase (ribokinase family)
VTIPRIVVLGNLLVDDIVFADGATRMGQAGGAVLYAALGAMLWNARPGLVSVVGDDYPHDMLQILDRRGADVTGVRELRRPGVRTWLLYEGHLRHLVHRLGCPTHEDVSPQPADIPVQWHAAPAWHLAPMPVGVQEMLLASLAGASGRFISIDPHFPVTEESLGAWKRILAGADAFFPGADELLLRETQSNPHDALRRLAGGRLRFVAFKRGAQGGILYDAHRDCFHDWTARTGATVDQTGAGDAFAAGFVCAYLEQLPIEVCLQRAIVTASFAVEAWGPEGLLAATRADAESRLHGWSRSEVRR